MYMYILRSFMDEVLSEEIVKKNNYWNGWKYSRWEFSGWEFSGKGEFSKGELMGGNFPGGNFPGGNFPRNLINIWKTEEI